ncbi:Triose-phosphate transporter domain [Macleaya cordata]|uniref:Triose-phosphate transporter domain n=1 Tax=Macleaya cordata TaxID=56857 RepID=A0A200PZ43_MACCD|nr:Triose-phosphate transporter domain [Macleaya cordata]
MQIIPREARNFGLGQGKYYFLLVALTVVWQAFSLGFLGIIYCTSSLFAGIFTTVMLPFTQIAATIAFDEKFTGQKGMSLALCLWGFTSYFLGEYKKTKMQSPNIVDAEEVKKNTDQFTESN